ncbi:MAG: PKD domain-containing protein, partial [Ferruginibacter sp.]
MKKIITLSASVIILSISIFAQTTKRALFLGNSYTYVNNLPQLIADLAASAGDTLIFDSNTPGGYTLQGHSGNTISLDKIMLGNWDFVVLQEQSQLPSFPITQVQTDVFPYAHTLDSLINLFNPCGETMFYMTWGRKNGDATNCSSWPPVCTYSGMDSLLRLRYMIMADSNNAVVSPVGAVWHYIQVHYPLIALYQGDGSHPSVAGSYAAACCFYTSIFRKNPFLITSDYSLSATDAANIRASVKTIVFDNLLSWHIGEYDLSANFSLVSSINNTVTFDNLSNNATSYKWNFGDGDTSTTANPAHTYTTNGYYNVSLIAYHCCYSDTITQKINLNTTGATNDNLQDSIRLYPNPFSTVMRLSHTTNVFKNAMLTVYNSYGQKVKQIDNLSGKTIVFHRDN